jgi:hypothetical protein
MRKTIPCVFHEEETSSLIVDEESGKFYCFSCGREGHLFDHNEIIKRINLLERGAINLEDGSFKSFIINRCQDVWPIKIILVNGICIEFESDKTTFYTDYFEIHDFFADFQKRNIILPAHCETEFTMRYIQVPYSAIAFFADMAS